MLAGLLRWFSSPGGPSHYRLWTAAWFALAGYYLIGAASFAVGLLGPTAPPWRYALSAATQSCSTVGCLLLVLGARGYVRGASPDRRVLSGLIAAGALLGLGVAAVAQFTDLRLFRQLYHGGLTAGAFLVSAVILWQARSALDRSGRFLAMALAGFGLSQLHLVAYMSSAALGYRPGYGLGVFTLLDLLWMVAIVATMAGMALADQREAASAALRRQEAQFRRMIEHSNDIVTVVSEELVVRYVSPSARRILGWDEQELAGERVLRYVHADDRATLQALADRPGSGSTPFVFRFRARDGNWLRLEAVATRVHDDGGERVIIVNARDLAERDRLEATVREAQKLECVGRLAGGVAHDLNNILTVICGTAELGQADCGDPSVRQAFGEITNASARAADLTRGLLSFARRQVVAPVAFDVTEAVRRVGRMAERLLPETIEFHVVERGGPHVVSADPGQVEQVVMNLVVNARDAIVGPGVIEVTIGDADITPQNRADAAPGRYVTIAVRDTGTGIPDHVRPYLFEPFFTTKVVGEGTGLGLATSYGIIRQSGGFITVASMPGQGATFVVHLPEECQKAPTVDTVAKEIASARGEAVLVVEDDPQVRRVGVMALQSAGFRVIEARDGIEGLARASGEPLRVLVTDMVMPRMGGLDLLRRIRDGQPNVGVLLVSGYPGDPNLLRSLPARTSFLQKPYSPAELTANVHALL
ncbi:MAG: ATP-binding protein [Vicinamibacterales bacterium]